MSLANLARPGLLHILLFHRVLERPDPLRAGEPDVAQFRRQMQMLKRLFRPIALDEGVRRLDEGTLPARSIAITFDDGYRDNLTLATPVLRELGVPATVFVATGFRDGSMMWNDIVIEAFRRCRQQQLDLSDLGLGMMHLSADVALRVEPMVKVLKAVKPKPPAERLAAVHAIAERCGYLPEGGWMLDEDGIRGLRNAGIAVGAHTVNHPILSSLSDDEARAEIAGSRETLTAVLDSDVPAFAYPNGNPEHDYLPRDVNHAREAGFRYAVSTRAAVAQASDDRFQLPRFGPWSTHPLRFAYHVARQFEGQRDRH